MQSMHANLNELAARQHSVFTGTQAIELGYTRKQIRSACDRGLWIRLQRDLYRLGGRAFDLRARLSAAVLAIPTAVVSHDCAAFLHGMPGFTIPQRAVITTSDTASRCAFARLHRYAGITAEDIVQIDGLPTTAPSLTLFHLAVDLDEGALGRLVDECVRLRLVAMSELFAQADYWTRVGRPRRRVMRRVLRIRSNEGAPESVLERAFLRLLSDHELPAPIAQFRAPWLATRNGRVDFAYPEHRLAIELDGRAWHTREGDFTRDRERDRSAQLAGWRTLRYTWDEVTTRPGQVGGEIRTALGQNIAVA